MLQVVERNGRRLLSLIEDLLTVSRLDSERLTVLVVPVDVNRLVESAILAVEAAVAKKDLELVVAVDAGLPPVAGDVEQLERALMNLLANAVKFTPDGGRICVSARAAGPCVEIEVRDTGIGIPHEEQAHLFQRFFRASTARDGAVQGTGLGLSIVKSIVDGHHGEVVVQSSPGVGTTVRLALPVCGAAAA
jgi:signal transduction histidine kinase